MTQKRIIIVGATSGIGKELAVRYVVNGWKVAVTGRRKNLLLELKELHPEMIISQFDVMDPGNSGHLESLVSDLGGLDVLIYSSGFGDVSPQLNWEIENTTIRTNVLGFAEIAAFAFNYFVRQGFGQIAIISSVAALRGNSWAPAYSASKAFMSNYAEGLNIKAKRLKKDIAITDIKPGFVDTKLAKGNKLFWVVPVQKAARQIESAIRKRKRVAYISKRWWLIAQLLRILPYGLYRRLV